jgi:general L-amino acid transport system permease protein
MGVEQDRATLHAPRLTAVPRALEWIEHNLLTPWYNAVLTIIALLLVYVILRSAITWATTQAEWGVIERNWRLFMVGQYPRFADWRIWAALYLLALLVGLSRGVWPQSDARAFSTLLSAAVIFFALVPPFAPNVRLTLLGMAAMIPLGMLIGRRWPGARRWTAAGWVALLPLTVLLVRGVEGTPLKVVQPTVWSGLLLTFLLTIVGIVGAFPLGVLLALGRRSDLPAIRAFSIGYIELIRGVPLITILFMAQIMLPLFLPGNVEFDRVVRAMAGIILFEAAYLAENVRGGLQSVPRGQEEAAKALGLNALLVMALIVLPQALRAVIPALVGQFISLFKDTSLVAIVGLLDLTGIGRAVLAQGEFLGRHQEVFLFIAVVYWVFSFTLSTFSRRLERTLGVGVR